MEFPRPPYQLSRRFVPAPELAEWARETFVMDGAMANPDHAHLASADVAVLLTDEDFFDRSRRVLGTAQMGRPTGKAWSKGAREQQIKEWFRSTPDFLITLYAPFLAKCELHQACAVMEHEMYHCGQKQGEDGPVFNLDDEPVFVIRGHDIEEFAGVVRRYGAWNEALENFMGQYSIGPRFNMATIEGCCGCGGAFV